MASCFFRLPPMTVGLASWLLGLLRQAARPGRAGAGRTPLPQSHLWTDCLCRCVGISLWLLGLLSVHQVSQRDEQRKSTKSWLFRRRPSTPRPRLITLIALFLKVMAA